MFWFIHFFIYFPIFSDLLKSTISPYIYIYRYIYVLLLATVVKGDQKAPFSIATTPLPRLLHFTLDTYLILVIVKQGGIKYHFKSLWYDATWDWIQAYICVCVCECIYVYIYICIYVVSSISFQAFCAGI